MKFLSGFESTYIFESGRDVLELTKHTQFVKKDLRLARDTGMEQLRYSIPWHTVERNRGEYDWSWTDVAMAELRELGIMPILDPLHHTSFPRWLEDGFSNPDFVSTYLDFVTAVAERYPWVKDYTVINEPFVTTWFCGHEGKWYPYHQGADRFVPMMMNVVEAIIRVSNRLIEMVPDVRLVHVDAAEKHRALDSRSAAHAEFSNNIRFLVHDMILGGLGEDHPLYEYLLRHGADRYRLESFQKVPTRIDVLGLDYYSHCELEWCTDGRIYPNRQPEGLVQTAREYFERYRLPIMLTETNIRGYVTDRLSWLKFMVEQCEQIERDMAEAGSSFEGFCWYPFIDSTDWCSLVKEARGCVDPQGIYWLDRQTMQRNASELSEVYTALAKGQITSKDIPAYHFQPPLDELLSGLMPMMRHWGWRQPTIEHPRTSRGAGGLMPAGSMACA
ncbi:MAG: family 1 glycosylhydrolase [Blastocatellia bacterium]|nr:family 1 glycosylhydrolase [Blastocatellia bacterium]